MDIFDYFPEKAKKSLSSNGKDIIQEIGIDIIKGVVLDVLTGKNLRDSTELLTRKRIVAVNVATLVMLIKGTAEDKDFINKIPNMAFQKLKNGHLSKNERWLMQWLLGLTDKGFQNILRDDTSGLEKYKNDFIDITQKAIEEMQEDYGDVRGSLLLKNSEKANLNWDFLIQLMTVVGAGTLAVRGSNKSTFGKLFEKLVLGALLSVLDFKLIKKNDLTNPERVFWLSSREDKRESDATLLYEAGKGIRFDIGFIGRGNPEISLDKVSRFEREIEMGKKKWYLGTIIIVDRIGRNSRIETLAQAIEGSIVQMSGAYWPVKIAEILNQTLGYDNPILHTPIDEMNKYLKSKISEVRFEDLIELPVFAEEISSNSENGNETK
jgi:hypothetical protein